MTRNKNLSKANKAFNSGRSDIWESRYFYDCDDYKHYAKQRVKRAQRRMNKAIIAIELEG